MYPTEVIVDYDILRENFKALQALKPHCHLVPVVKSDAYGHGLVQSSRAFLAGGAERLAVFRVEEGLALRQEGIDCPIWVLLGALPYEAAQAVGRGFTLAVFDIEQAKALSEAAERRGLVQDVHVAVDTGMGRLGFLVDDLQEALAQIFALKGLRVCGIFSHIAKANDVMHPVTRRQVDGFRRALKMLPSVCVENHSCASDAWLGDLIPELHYARPGICLYQEYQVDGRIVTHDAMTLKTRLVSLKTMPAGATVSYNCIRTLTRESRVAVAPLGYEDGFLRSMTDKGAALVHGRRAPILGTICMSMTMLDVTDIPEAAIGDEAVFMGCQGDEQITIAELAERANTTPHEFLCAMGKHRA
ncbi:MAG: alanine racemase [Victivallales bacterium]|nr:alanine racemase [Victivallales bacterium]